MKTLILILTALWASQAASSPSGPTCEDKVRSSLGWVQGQGRLVSTFDLNEGEVMCGVTCAFNALLVLSEAAAERGLAVQDLDLQGFLRTHPGAGSTTLPRLARLTLHLARQMGLDVEVSGVVLPGIEADQGVRPAEYNIAEDDLFPSTHFKNEPNVLKLLFGIWRHRISGDYSGHVMVLKNYATDHLTLVDPNRPEVDMEAHYEGSYHLNDQFAHRYRYVSTIRPRDYEFVVPFGVLFIRLTP